MLYRCQNCGRKVFAGWMPSASSSLYFLALMAVSSTIYTTLLVLWREHVRATRGAGEITPVEWGYWNLLWVPISFMLAFAVVVIGALVLCYVLERLEYLWVCCRKCPKCASRRWSKGYTNGFGL